MARQFLSEIVGEAYKTWRPGDEILITNGTGAGKTWFTLNVLLAYARSLGKHVVYYCNRKILNYQVQAAAAQTQSAAKEQLLTGLDGVAQENMSYFHVRTYQHSERVKDYPDIKALDENGRVIPHSYEVTKDQVLYYVFDESMYPVQDASFSVHTAFWRTIVGHGKNEKAISIFLTATPEPFYLFRMYCKNIGLRDGLRIELDYFLAKWYVSKGINILRWRDYLVRANLVRWGLDKNALQEYVGDPYQELLDWVEEAYKSKGGGVTHFFGEERTTEDRYSYAAPRYFDDIMQLVPVITASVKESVNRWMAEKKRLGKKAPKEKPIQDGWLIFVRTVEDGKLLRKLLVGEGCEAVLLTADDTKKYDGSKARQRGGTKYVMSSMIYREYLPVRVLLCTSVLDNGVTLHSGNIGNVVICQPDKVSFLQMMGRVRVREGERINLYLQKYSPYQVRRFAQSAMDEFTFLARYMKNNVLESKSAFTDWDEPDIFDPYHRDEEYFLTAAEHRKLVGDLEGNMDRQDRMRINKYIRKSRGSHDLPGVDDYKVNPMSILYFLGQVYFYKRVLGPYEGDPNYFLKEQLSWIGKTYDPTCWIDHGKVEDQLRTYLEEKLAEGRPMDREAQEAFKENCTNILLRMRQLPTELKSARNHHGEDMNPLGKSALNRIFVRLGLPYEIRSKVSKKQLRDPVTGGKLLDPETGKPKQDGKTYWHLTALAPEQMEKRTEEDQARQEESARKKAAAQETRERREAQKREEEAKKHRFHVDLPAVAAERKAALEAEEQARRSKEKPMKVQIFLGDQVMYSSEGIRQEEEMPKPETKDAQGEET